MILKIAYTTCNKECGKQVIEVYTDGASSGNPGPSGIGIVIKSNKDFHEFSFPAGNLSNHEVEFQAVIKALELCKEKFPNEILSFRTDSKIVADTVEKKYSKNKAFLPLLERIQELAEDFPYFFIKWIPEKQNTIADRLARSIVHKEKNKVSRGKKVNTKSIILIGFMGVGKTTLGKELAKKLNRGFIDIDSEIENTYGMQTVDIFKVYGEEEFRRAEKAQIKKACATNGKIVSVGGGAFLQEDTRSFCMKNAIVLFLHISWDAWKERINLLIDTRPVLQGKDIEEIKDLFNKRQAIYKDHHLKINIDHLNVLEAVEVIKEELQRDR